MPPRVRTAVLVCAALLAALGVFIAGYGVGGRDGDAMPVRRVVIAGSTDSNVVRDKWVTAECPSGSTVVGGGAVVPHGNDTPGVAVYWSAPYTDHGVQGWWAAAQDQDRGRRPWLLQVQAICLHGVRDAPGGGGALPAETFSPAG